MKDEEEKVIVSYKGFDENLQCRGYQYEVGKEYVQDGEIKCCNTGFHACESPLEVLEYYFLGDDCKMARFCEVEQSGMTDTENNGSTKIASSKIKIKAELKFGDLIKAGVEWLKEKTSPVNIQDGGLNDKGKQEKKIGSSGDSAQIGSSGDSAKIGSSGYSAKIGSSGDYAKINSTGEDSVVMCAGNNSMAKARKGSWITLAEWKYSEEKKRYVPKCVKAEYVDGERIKEDTTYKLIDGEFKEVEL